MTTKEYLSQIKRYDCMIDNGLKEIQRYQDLATSITKAIDGERIQSSARMDKLGDAVSSVVDIENEICYLVEQHKKARNEIVFKLQGIGNTKYYNLLHKRYVLCMDLYDIADEMGVSYGRIRNINSEAMCEFEKIYGSEYKNKKLPYKKMTNITKKCKA